MMGSEKKVTLLDHPLLPVSVIILLGGWTTLFLPGLIFPLPGIAASVYGLLTKKRLWAFLVGLVPYIPFLLLGGPRAGLPLVLGIPAGAMGVGAAVFRQRKTPDYQAGLGIILILIAVAYWLLLLARLST